MKTQSTLPVLSRSMTCLVSAFLLLLPGLGVAQAIFDFSQSSTNCSESDVCIVLRVVRSGATGTPASVDYCTQDGTACSGVRYTACAGTLQFAAGQTSREVMVPILNDGYAQNKQAFRVLLSNPSVGAMLGTQTNATVSITDNDLGVQFINPSVEVSEGAGVLRLLILRIGDGGNPLTVDLSSTDITAKAGVDYVAISNQVTFAPAELLRVVTVPILNNAVNQGTRSFRVSLTNAVGTSLGRLPSTTVNIVEDDAGFRFESARASVGEDVGAALIHVLRGTDDASTAAGVDFYTLDQAAASGSDYVGVTNTLTFAPGETQKTVAVRILNDGDKESSQSFQIRLANPSAGMALGSPSAAAITIIDNDPQVGFEQTSHMSPWGANEIALTIVRGNDVHLAPFTVNYATSDMSARAGIDYQAASGTLQFDANATVKTLRIPILVNRPAGAAKSFRVTLTNPNNGAVLGAAWATVNIQGTFFTIGPRFDPQLTLRQDSGFNLLKWLGNGQLQRADQLDGPWVALASVQSPQPISASLPGSFYRIKNPRPVRVYVPDAYNRQNPMPLVIALHGYTSNGADIDNYFSLTSFAASKGFLYCYPEGVPIRSGAKDWNCWFDDPVIASAYSNPWSDDVGFIRGIIEAVGEQFNLDRKRVYLVGHSQGGGMSHYAALHCSDLIAGIVSLAGDPATFYPPPSHPVNILHIHGTADETVPYVDTLYTTAPFPPLMPGALHIGQIWADFNGATGRVTEPAPSLDLDTTLVGPDTVITRWANAPPGGAVEVWSILRGSHGPSLSTDFTPKILDWLFAHPKP
jgi:poly(3-hydroxybutyrate) depolymerase